MLIYKDGQVAHYKEIFSNTSFSASGPSDEFLAEQGAVKVNVFKDHNRATQKLVSAEPYVEDGWCYTVTVADKTDDEIAADADARAAQVRAQRDRLLADSDWTQVLDAPVDRTAWATYRQALRDLPQAENFPDVAMPAMPGSTAGNVEA
jgi:hypothetical protein